MMNSITPAVAKKILATGTVINAIHVREGVVLMAGYTVSAGAFRRFKSRLPPGYIIQF